MIQKIFIIISMGLLLLTSCQQNEPVQTINQTTKYGDEVPVKFSFSINKGLETNTEYNPMRVNKAAQEMTNKATIYNNARIVLAKQISDYWVVDQIIDHSLVNNPDDVNTNRFHVQDGRAYQDVNIELRPGKYRAITFTGGVNRSWLWNPDVKVGTIIKEDNLPLAISYRTEGSNSYPTYLEKNLSEEVFTGMEEFTVEKTDDLHSSPVLDKVSIILNRAVARFRISLQYEEVTPGPSFVLKPNACVVAFLAIDPDDTDKAFCNGLDIFGKPFYDKKERLTRIIYSTYAKDDITFQYNENDFIIPHSGGRTFASCYFTDPDVTDLKVLVLIQKVSFYQGYADFYYTGVPPEMALKHNTLTGVVFRAGAELGDRSIDMTLITESNGITPLNSASMFSPFLEYNQ